MHLFNSEFLNFRSFIYRITNFFLSNENQPLLLYADDSFENVDVSNSKLK